MANMYSIIIPTLNEEIFLPNLLKSLVNQTDKNFEVIVVDGSSKDKTVAVAKSFAAKLPTLHVMSTKACLPLQRNEGARHASGEWFIFVDADSVFMPYFMERVTAFITKEHPSVFTTWFRSDSENPKDSIYTLFGDMYLEATILFKKPHAPGPLTLVTRNAYNAVGGYDESHLFHEDVDFGQRLHKAGFPLHLLRETLYVWSLRRFRREGVLKVLNQYIVSILPVVFLNTSWKRMPGYSMGGHPYGKKIKKSISKTNAQKFQRNLKKLLKEVFE